MKQSRHNGEDAMNESVQSDPLVYSVFIVKDAVLFYMTVHNVSIIDPK